MRSEHRRGAEAGEVTRAGATADAQLAASHLNDGKPVFDAAASGARARVLLSDGGSAMSETGVVFDRMADDLTAARTAAQRQLETITGEINAVIAARNDFFARNGRGLPPEDVAAAEREFHADAASRVAQGAERVQRVLDTYNDQTAQHATRLAALPHAPPVSPAAASPLSAVAGVAGAFAADVVNAAASVGNAIAHNPVPFFSAVGGIALIGVSAAGVAGGSAVTVTGVGAAPGVPLAAVSFAGIATGGTITTIAGGELLKAALGPDRVTPAGSNLFGDTFPAAAATAPTMIDAAGNAWDRNGTWEKLHNAIPAGKDIAHTPTSRTHIPFGQYYPDGSVGGGHIYDSAVPDKTVFPEGWTAQKILDEVLDVARNPDQVPTTNPKNGRWTVSGTRDGVEITVILEPDGKIVTAHPERGPGVHVNDADGEPQPQGN